MHLALLVDTVADAVEARLSARSWCGPDRRPRSPTAAIPAVVLAELFASARRSIIVSTFVVQQPEWCFGRWRTE